MIGHVAQYKHLRLFQIETNPLQQRQREGSGFAGTSLSLTDHVTTFQKQLNCLLLNRRGICVAGRFNSGHQWRTQTQLAKPILGLRLDHHFYFFNGRFFCFSHVFTFNQSFDFKFFRVHIFRDFTDGHKNKFPIRDERNPRRTAFTGALQMLGRKLLIRASRRSLTAFRPTLTAC